MSKTPVSDAARAAFEPIRAREQEHHVKVQLERKTRAEQHFRRVFGVPQQAVLEGDQIVFTIEGHRLAYVGNLQEQRRRGRIDAYGRVRPTFTGPGWMYLERCAGCKQDQAVAFVGRLDHLGRLLENGIPEWECPNCNMATSPPAAKGFLRR